MKKNTVVNDKRREEILRPYMLAGVSEDELKAASVEQLFTAVIICNAEQEQLRRQQLFLGEGELQEMREGEPRRRPVAQELVRTAYYRDDLRIHKHRLALELYKRLCSGGDPDEAPDPQELLNYFWECLGVDLEDNFPEISPDEMERHGLEDLFDITLAGAARLGGRKDPDGRTICAKQYDGAGVVLLVDREDLD